jgi:hypothetical protein
LSGAFKRRSGLLLNYLDREVDRHVLRHRNRMAELSTRGGIVLVNYGLVIARHEERVARNRDSPGLRQRDEVWVDDCPGGSIVFSNGGAPTILRHKKMVVLHC